jgi:DNA repair protein RecO (recombination protein O)
MEATYPTKAIILKREARGEDDSRVVVYTYDHGMLDLIARGTKKIKSKLAGHLEPLCLSNIMVVNGKQYNYIGAAVSDNCYPSIKADWDRSLAAGSGINIFNHLVKENLKDEKLYLLLKEYLETLNNLANNSKLIFYKDIFILKLISLLGRKPELYNCVQCKKRPPPLGNSFDFIKGGLVCQQCIKTSGNNIKGLTLSEKCIKVLRLADKSDFTVFAKLKLTNQVTEEVNRLVSKLVEFFY